MSTHIEFRNLDGAFYRVERDGKWQNICLSDMTDEEREGKIKGQGDVYLMNVIHLLCHTIRKIGDQFDIVRE